MCDFAGGQAIALWPREGPAAGVAWRALESVLKQYGGRVRRNLDNFPGGAAPPVWKGGAPSRLSDRGRKFLTSPFQVYLLSVPHGEELSFVEQVRGAYVDEAVRDADAVRQLADRDQRLAVSPNWRLHPAAGVPEAVTAPFALGANHAEYLKRIGLMNASANDAAGITVAVLDNGFDPAFWLKAPPNPPISSGQDLIAGDTSSSGHGTLVAALIASSAPAANIVPIRMAGTESTEWDALHALACAVDFGADVVTFSYRQILADDKPCKECGLVRTGARSEVFARMIEWASNNGDRAILAAAGNDGIGSVARPAAYRGAIPVAALDSRGTALWSRSNWDARNLLNVLAMPGEHVAASADGTSYSGTSFATGYAAALFAVAMSRGLAENAFEIMMKLLTTYSFTRVSNASVPRLM